MYQSSSRRSSMSSIISSWSSHSEDAGSTHELAPSEGLPATTRRQSTAVSELSCDGMTGDETKDLWKCMLELQERYGCYHSTRIDLALGAGEDAVDLMPNPFILDTLNESVHDLPEEGWEMLEQHLRHTGSEKPKSKSKFWKRG